MPDPSNREQLSDQGACPTCGARVTVMTGGEGTSHYQPLGDRLGVIERWKIRSSYSFTAGDGYPSQVTARVEGPEVSEWVEVVRASDYEGAVDLLREIGESVGARANGADAKAMAAKARTFIASLDHPRGQSSPTGRPACSPDPKTARPPHTCSGEQS